MSEAKQTSVEWLENELKKRYTSVNFDKLFNQAKAMEKEQIKDAFNTGYSYDLFNGGGEQYYNETYGQ